MKSRLQNLYRLPLDLRVKILWYYLKRLLHLPFQQKEQNLNEYFVHLIDNNGQIIKHNESGFLSRYLIPSTGEITVCIRHQSSSDLYVFEQIFHQEEYKPLVDTILRTNSADNALCILDAGANVGFTSVYLKKKFPNAQIVAIEPDTGNAEMMRQNIALNHYSDIHIITDALWPRDAFLHLVSDFRDRREWSFRVEESENENDIPAYSIHTILKKFKWTGVDVWKIDIEGSEKFIFEDTITMNEILPAVHYVAIEIHDEFNCRDQIYSTLTKNGFEFFTSVELTIAENKKYRTG